MTSATARRNMILGQLYTNDIHDPRLLEALNDVPREPFMPEHLRGAAYVDEDLEVAEGRFMIAPLTFARLLAMTDIQPGDRVLIIGCLTGYCAAVAAKLSGHVEATELSDSMIAETLAHGRRLGLTNLHLHHVPSLPDGYQPSAPYDVIIIPGAINFLPESLGGQLAIGGRLATIRNVASRPGQKGGLGKGLLVRRLEQRLQHREYFDASSTVLPGFERENGFSF